MLRRLASGLLPMLLCGCIGLSVTRPPPVPPEPPTPPRFKAEQGPPLLESTDIPGIRVADSLDRTYYDEKSEQWYRFAMNRWFMAFTWDGAWFPLTKKEVRPELLERHKPPPPKTRKQRLEDLEKRLEELEELEKKQQRSGSP